MKIFDLDNNNLKSFKLDNEASVLISDFDSNGKPDVIVDNNRTIGQPPIYSLMNIDENSSVSVFSESFTKLPISNREVVMVVASLHLIELSILTKMVEMSWLPAMPILGVIMMGVSDFLLSRQMILAIQLLFGYVEKTPNDNGLSTKAQAHYSGQKWMRVEEAITEEWPIPTLTQIKMEIQTI